MGFSNAFRALDVTDKAENSTASITQLPANLLEAFIPGYSVISNFVLEALGIDITLVVSVCLLLFGLITASTFLWRHAFDLFEKFCMSAISVESHDDIYDHIMAWLSAQKVTQNSRSLMAKTGRESAWDLTNSEIVDEDMDENVLLNFSNWDAKVPPTYEPFFGNHLFWHKGMYFKFSRENKQTMYSGWGGSTVVQNDENIRLTCVGRSTIPIKDLIKEARDCYLNKEKACTVVRRPAPKDQRGRGRGVWHKVATRPSRPMDTIVLDHHQKDRILGDINEYLHPATPRWYANRGIPYRRGYLFAGPPGTGKSSLAWAIAGVFGLDIYCISLVEPSLTEEDLGLMFTSLPRRCVVLLEDIDSAGLIKRQDAGIKTDKSKEDDAAAKLGAEISKALTTAQQSNDKSNKNNQGISLSGLLNAIDGVASHEGRVLVMTSNFPEKLDDALIRPGRIDMRIDFTKATRSQMSELFTRMYSPDTPAQPTKFTTWSATSGPAPATDVHRIGEKVPQPRTNSHLLAQELTPPESPREATMPSGTNEKTPAPTTPASDLTASQLHDIATKFAATLEEDTFTPAEIQGFLLTRKKEPVRALSEVDAWKVSVLEAREKKKAAVAETDKGA